MGREALLQFFQLEFDTTTTYYIVSAPQDAKLGTAIFVSPYLGEVVRVERLVVRYRVCDDERAVCGERDAHLRERCIPFRSCGAVQSAQRHVGKRLRHAVTAPHLARKVAEQLRQLLADSPTAQQERLHLSEEGRLALHFNNAKSWTYYDPAWGVDYGFEIAGADGVWKKAYLVNGNDGKTKVEPWKTKGVIEGRDLLLAADGIEKPLKVRYLYEKPWIGGLFADSGLPLGPFEAEVK